MAVALVDADTVNWTAAVPLSVSEAGSGEALQLTELLGDWHSMDMLDV